MQPTRSGNRRNLFSERAWGEVRNDMSASDSEDSPICQICQHDDGHRLTGTQRAPCPGGGRAVTLRGYEVMRGNNLWNGGGQSAYNEVLWMLLFDCPKERLLVRGGGDAISLLAAERETGLRSWKVRARRRRVDPCQRKKEGRRSSGV